MSKKLICLLLALMMMLTAAVSCKDGGSATKDTEAETTPEGTTTEKETYVSSSVDDPDEPDGVLIANEGASKYVIVRGENASPSEVTAANELKNYLKKITGVELPVVTDATAETKYEIVVGKTNREEAGEFDREEFGEDGFVIKVTGKKLWLVGGEKRGTLYSVFTFLEEYLGCRYYSETVEKIPTMSTILLDENMPEDKQIPQFFYRNVYITGTVEFNAKLKINGMNNVSSDEYGGYTYINVNHNLFNMMAPYVGYVDGVYGPIDYEANSDLFSTPGYSQPCFTNPRVVEIITENVRKELTNNPNWKVFSLGFEDNSRFCTCENCTKALEEEEGHISGVYLRMVNAIAGNLKEEFPNVLFSAFAYNEAVEPSTVTKAADNVIITYTAMCACNNHPIRNDAENGCAPIAAHLGKVASEHSVYLSGWNESSDGMLMWDYPMNYVSTGVYFPNFHTMRDNINFYAENGVLGILELIVAWKTPDFYELRNYILAKLLWDPYMSDEEYQAHINDFLLGFYGPGAEYIREFMKFTEEHTKDICTCCYMNINATQLHYSFSNFVDVNPEGTYPPDLTADMIRNYEQTDWSKYLNWYKDLGDKAVYNKGRECFAKALELAENDVQRENIETASIQMDLLESYMHAMQYRCGKSGFGKIVEAFFNANPGVFTADEQSSLKRAINNFARTQTEEAHKQFNIAVKDNMIAHGCLRINEKGSHDLTMTDSLNMSNIPCFWYPWP